MVNKSIEQRLKEGAEIHTERFCRLGSINHTHEGEWSDQDL